jgi:hypothetical protein
MAARIDPAHRALAQPFFVRVRDQAGHPRDDEQPDSKGFER